MLRQYLGGEENRIVSPLNLWMAMAMLTELTEGDTRADLLTVLGCEDVEQVRERASALWSANYIDDGVTASRLAARRGDGGRE